MMVISWRDVLQVQVHHGAVAHRVEEFPHHLRGHVSHLFSPERGFKGKIRPAAQIQRAEDQGFVHRDDAAAVAGDPSLVAHCPGDGLSQDDPGIFDGMVIVDLQVPVRLDRQVKESVPGESVQHMVEEADPGIDLRDAGAVQVQLDLYAGLRGIPLNFRYPCHFPLLPAHSRNAPPPNSRGPSVPLPSRRSRCHHGPPAALPVSNIRYWIS